MSTFKCKMCGGALEIQPGQTVAECEYCGTRQTVAKSRDEVITNLFTRANNLRMKSEFDRAEQTYEKILELDNTEAEAHWGLVLCRYGIEYVEDPKTFKRIPTCHRTSYKSVSSDADYLAALEHADSSQKAIYQAEANAIDSIQKNILAIVKNEQPFDVFICYKESDENGRRTHDSVIANDIYHQLTQEGFNVFYAAVTLEDKLGQEYEPYIFAALNSAKVMLVLGTKAEYFGAVWVKNEWSRFLALMKNDRSKLLIPCYRDMDAYDLPDEFAHLQAQDMGKIGFINDIVRGIKKVVVTDAAKSGSAKVTQVVTEAAAGNANTAPLLKRAFMFLEDGDWKSANEYCEKVLDIDPENAQAYLGKLMAELRVSRQKELKDAKEPFDEYNNYQKVLRFADEKLKTELIGYIDHINTRNENERLAGIYRKAQNAMSEAASEDAYKRAAVLFESICEYRDSAALAKNCYENAETERKDAILSFGKSKMQNAYTVRFYEAAMESFASIPGWKDADECADTCRKKIEEIKAKEEADRLESQRRVELARQEAARKAKRNKKIAIIATPIVCAIIAFLIVLNAVIIPNNKYNDAVALMDAGQYEEAIAGFVALDGYKDSNEIITKCELEIIKAAKVGDTVIWGSYEQDNNTSNGKEEIEWLVLDKQGDRILVISKYALDCKPYNESYTAVTWETCTLRKWLNSDFLNAAFSDEEKEVIPTVTVSADKNPDYSTNPGNATQDQVFLLSITEVNQYFSSDRSRQCKPTDYAVANGAYVNSDSGNCWWWLRSPGFDQRYAADVDHGGGIIEYGRDVSNCHGAVRPALWIDLGS